MKIGSVTAEILLILNLCSGWVGCKVIFMSNPTKVMLGWGWVEFGLSWGFDKCIQVGRKFWAKLPQFVWHFLFFCSQWGMIYLQVCYTPSRYPWDNLQTFSIHCPHTLQIHDQNTRPGKSRKHAIIACGQFLRKLWTFLHNQQHFCSFYPLMATSLQYLSTMNLFLFKNIQSIGKNAI